MKPVRRYLPHSARSLGFLALVSCTLAASGLLSAQNVPAFIDYQGKLLDGNGAPLAATAPANFEVEFRIWDAATAGNLIWAEKQLVTVSNGMFSVRLGEGQTIQGNGGADIGAVPHDGAGLTGAFQGKDRFLGLTVKIQGQTPGEIVPRLSFLSAPYALKAASASALSQAPGTTSNLTVGSIAYSTATLSSTAQVDATQRTVMVNATSGQITATLPVDAAQKEVLIAKKDATLNQVLVAPPAGGTINGNTSPIRLKVKGESVTIQNTGGNEWWVVNENRDKTPVGTIIAFGGNGAAPAGYLICDGVSLSRAAQPELFAAVGGQWGAVDGNSFSLPNLEGRFLRGIGSGNGADDDATTRFAVAVGGATGRNVGTYQHEEFRGHNHPGSTNFAGEHNHGHNAPGGVGNNGLLYSNSNGGNTVANLDTTVGEPAVGESSRGLSLSSAGNHSHTVTTNNVGGNESRPDNAGVRYCIKY